MTTPAYDKFYAAVKAASETYLSDIAQGVQSAVPDFETSLRALIRGDVENANANINYLVSLTDVDKVQRIVPHMAFAFAAMAVEYAIANDLTNFTKLGYSSPTNAPGRPWEGAFLATLRAATVVYSSDGKGFTLYELRQHVGKLSAVA